MGEVNNHGERLDTMVTSRSLSSELCIGVPVILGKNGIEKIVEIELEAAEKVQLTTSEEGVKATNALLNEIGAL